MRYLMHFLLLIPFIAHSQTETVRNLILYMPDKAVTFSLGHAFDNAYAQELQRGGYLRASLSLLKQNNSFRYGITAEGGTNSNDYWYLTPGFLANMRVPCGNTYYYVGGMAGYVLSKSMMPLPYERMLHGYVLGVQGGVTLPLSWNWQLNTEIAFRSTQIWEWASFPEARYSPHFIMYFPVTVGLRYQWTNRNKWPKTGSQSGRLL